MNTWFSKSLGDAIWAFTQTGQIETLFPPLFAAAGGPVGMAVFTRYESEGRLQCEVLAYFSPAAAELAHRVGAQPCQKPSRQALDLLAGAPGCWAVLFPGSE
ncbi:hypothetical protein [Polaromonas sp.]|uniref:hypothetical protein n=1 Tax=Polaromonas sp. TaxID=1869339 RepID=UPI002FC5D789